MSKVEFEESVEEKFEKSKSRVRIVQRIVWAISLAIVILGLAIIGLGANYIIDNGLRGVAEAAWCGTNPECSL